MDLEQLNCFGHHPIGKPSQRSQAVELGRIMQGEGVGCAVGSCFRYSVRENCNSKQALYQTRYTSNDSMTHSVFDPLGMVAPVQVEPKLLLRELCNHGWDDQIDDDKIKRWQTWLGSLCQLEGLSIPLMLQAT